ncbi:hypothetical protein [Sorangium sp. So ce1335]|uniref:hypothetical protein n=1 Tax=Sorangium sp. So ce1335 TaxID=3133335 RepID=UPI003F61FC9B
MAGVERRVRRDGVRDARQDALSVVASWASCAPRPSCAVRRGVRLHSSSRSGVTLIVAFVFTLGLALGVAHIVPAGH